MFFSSTMPHVARVRVPLRPATALRCQYVSGAAVDEQSVLQVFPDDTVAEHTVFTFPSTAWKTNQSGKPCERASSRTVRIRLLCEQRHPVSHHYMHVLTYAPSGGSHGFVLRWVIHSSPWCGTTCLRRDGRTCLAGSHRAPLRRSDAHFATPKGARSTLPGWVSHS